MPRSQDESVGGGMHGWGVGTAPYASQMSVPSHYHHHELELRLCQMWAKEPTSSEEEHFFLIKYHI